MLVEGVLLALAPRMLFGMFCCGRGKVSPPIPLSKSTATSHMQEHALNPNSKQHQSTKIIPHDSQRRTASLARWLRRPPRERKVPGSNPACAGIFSGPSHTSDFNNGTPVATLPGAWRYRVSAGTGRPGVSIL